MVLGVGSVTTATKQHNTVGMLNSPLSVRLWLSRGRPTLYLQAEGVLKPLGAAYGPMVRSLFPPSESLGRLHETLHTGVFPGLWSALNDQRPQKYKDLKDFRTLPLESSISALKAVSLPRHLLDLAVMFFLIGIGLYELFLWLSREGQFSVNYRNIFIVFIVSVGVYVIYDLAISFARYIDEDKKNSEFETNTLGGLNKPEKLQELEKELADVQDRLSSVAILDEKRQQMRSRETRIFEILMEGGPESTTTTTTTELVAMAKQYKQDLDELESQRAEVDVSHQKDDSFSDRERRAHICQLLVRAIERSTEA